MNLFTSLVVLLSLSRHSIAASDEKPPPKPCTIHSPSTGSFIDLRPLGLTRGGSGSSSQSTTNESYHAKGYDYPYNFTLNFCEPVVEELEDVTGVSSRLWSNVSAFYKDNRDNVISIGQQNSELLFRGKKLLLNYTMGSPCPDLDEHGHPIPDRHYRPREILDGDDDDEDDDGGRSSHKAAKRRKTTMMIFSCDTSPLLSGRPAINFLGTPDHCTYTFEVRSRHACGGTTTHHESGTLGPGSVFLVISGIALLVYLIGGVVYQRNVMHQRGWRQLPNYGLWAGLFGFISDMTIILFGSCLSRMPSVQRLFGGRGRGGYHRVGTSDDYRDSRGSNGSAHGGRGSGGVAANGRAGRGGDSDAENRLIDSYDEEWDT